MLTQNQLSDLAHLIPPSAMMLINEVGAEAVALLVEQLGGQRLFFPGRKKGPSWEKLANAVGKKVATDLCTHYAGLTMEIPKLSSALVEARNRAIRAARREANQRGVPTLCYANEVASWHNLAVRHVYVILSAKDKTVDALINTGNKKAQHQQELFA